VDGRGILRCRRYLFEIRATVLRPLAGHLRGARTPGAKSANQNPMVRPALLSKQSQRITLCSPNF